MGTTKSEQVLIIYIKPSNYLGYCHWFPIPIRIQKSFPRVFPHWLPPGPRWFIWIGEPAPSKALVSFVPLFNFTLTAKPLAPLTTPTRRLVATTWAPRLWQASIKATPIPTDPHWSWHSLIANYYSLMSSSCWWMNAGPINCASGQRYWSIFLLLLWVRLGAGRVVLLFQRMGRINLFALFKFLFW